MLIRSIDENLGYVDWRFERVVVDFRNEEILHFTKEFKTHKLIRVFNKANSVFSEWQEDNPVSLRKCTREHDFAVWKIRKMRPAPEEKDYQDLMDLIL